MKNISKLLILILGLFFTLLLSITNAQDSQSNNLFDKTESSDSLQIKLQNAILTALEHNPTIVIQKLQPKVAKTYVDEQRSAFDPVLSASATRNKAKTQRFLGSRPDPFEMTSERSEYNLGLSESLPTGTAISANASMSSSISSIYSDQYTGYVGVTISQALLQGFGTVANLADLRRAKIDYEISKNEFKRIAEEITATIEQAYWDVYLTNEEVNIHTKSLELARQQLKESEERVAVGKLPELELAAVHAEVATRNEELIDAQSQYEQARLQFLYILNPQQENAWKIVPSLVDRPFIPTDTLDNIEIHDQLGLKYRSDLKQAKLNLEKGKLEISRTKNGLLPQLDFFITLGRTTYSRTFKDAVPDVKSPFYDINGGFTFNFPVPDRSEIAQFRRAKYSHEQLELSLKNMERLVQKDVRSAYVEALRSRKQIEATRVARDLQSKKLEAELEKFRVGKSTNFLVLQAQRDFTASQLNEARAMVAYLNALVDLYLMEGTLLERRGLNTMGEN